MLHSRAKRAWNRSGDARNELFALLLSLDDLQDSRHLIGRQLLKHRQSRVAVFVGKRRCGHESYEQLLEVPDGAVVEVPGGEMTEENRVPFVYFTEHGNDWRNVAVRSTQKR